jgi:hypothetical protein
MNPVTAIAAVILGLIALGHLLRRVRLNGNVNEPGLSARV